MSDGQGAQLTIFWKQDDPPETIKQILKPSQIVYVDIMSEFDKVMKKMKLIVRNIREQKPFVRLFFDVCLFFVVI